MAYHPANETAEVGGDWYDVLVVPRTGAVVVVVGDVEGHDARAASVMGRVSSVIRAEASRGEGPAAVQVRNWQQLEYVPPQPLVGRGGYQDHPRFQWDGGIGYVDGVARPGYREEWQAFAQAIHEGSECHANVEDAWQAMRIIEALNESVRTGSPVSTQAV